MELKTRRPNPRLRVDWLRWGAFLVVLAVGLAFAERRGFGLGLRERAEAAATRTARYVVANLTAEPLRIQIDIGHEHFEKLALKRQRALEEGILLSSPDDFVPARVRAGDVEMRVKLRLKGDMSDHWQDPWKWSLRVVVKDEGTLLGMRQFSLQHPSTRDYVNEWIMHRALAREGLPALRYEFARVIVNGRDQGIYAVEEHFEKRLVENNQRREGPIVRFDEDLCWAEIRGEPGIARVATCLGSGAGSFLAANVDAFHTRKLLEAPSSERQFVRAVGLLEGFRKGDLATSEVFDPLLLARHFAVLELLDRLHASFWRNVRFYYNPLTARLEPIAFDGGSSGQVPLDVLAPAFPALFDGGGPNYYAYSLTHFARLFSDPVFYRRYIEELTRVAAPGYLEELFEELETPLAERLRVLHTDYPQAELERERLEARRRLLRKWLDPPKLAHAHWLGAKAGVARLAVANVQYLDVELIALRHAGRRIAIEPPLTLPGRHPSKALDYVEVEVPWEGAGPADPSLLRLEQRLVGRTLAQQAAVYPWPQLSAEALRRDFARADATASAFEFIVTDAAAGVMRIQPGVWFVRDDLIVPAGYRLRAGPGVELVLENGAALVSRSPLEWVGTERSPVVLRSATGTGGGLLVLSAGGSTRLDHVRFENLSAPARDGTAITGAVTFYESPVTARHVAFVDSRAEDALNLVLSDFAIEDSAFRGSRSDALDLDFCEGSLRRSQFIGSGNDAVDLSGSVVQIEALRVDGAGDKGVSVGERSRATGSDLRLRGVETGIASKDLSFAAFTGVRIESAQIGMTAYQKKSEFGGATLEVEGLEAIDVVRPFAVGPGSTIRLDGADVAPDGGPVGE